MLTTFERRSIIFCEVVAIYGVVSNMIFQCFGGHTHKTAL